MFGPGELRTSSLGKVSAAVLRWLGLTEKHRRVFVSYRRSDSLLIGEQLWEKLNKAGFRTAHRGIERQGFSASR